MDDRGRVSGSNLHRSVHPTTQTPYSCHHNVQVDYNNPLFNARGDLLRGGSSPNQQRRFEANPLHLLGNVYHLIQGGSDQTRQTNNICGRKDAIKYTKLSLNKS